MQSIKFIAPGKVEVVWGLLFMALFVNHRCKPNDIDTLIEPTRPYMGILCE